MGMIGEPRTRAFGAPTPSDVKEKNRRAVEDLDRATGRFKLASVIASVEGSLGAKREFVRQAMNAGLLPPGRVPSRETIRKLQGIWDAGGRTIDAYLDQPRSGRPPEVLPSAIEGEIRRVIEGGWEVNAHKLTQLFEEAAEKHGWKSPTYRQVRRRFAQAGRLVRSSARHGSRAGEIDGLPHARIVTRTPHDTWALDELTFPVYGRVFEPLIDGWVSALLEVVLIVDVCSTAVVGYHMVDPSGRKDENGCVMRGGFDTDDVLGALLSAAIPDLAPDSTRAFSGYLASRIRWDNAGPHKTLRESLGRACVAVDIRPIRKRRAASNAAVERRVGIMKDCGVERVLGHVDDYLPTDRVTSLADTDLALERTKAAGYTDQRVSRLTPIRPEDLHSVEELREIFDGIVRRYNFMRENRMFRLTPRTKYERLRDRRRPRNGKDLVAVIRPRTTTVGQNGIEHARDRKTQRYFPIIDGSLLLLDTMVTYHPDPLGRGIFVQHHRDLVLLRPQEDFSEQEARQVGRNATAITRALSDYAQDLRFADAAYAIGMQALRAGLQEHHERAVAVKAQREAQVEARRPAPEPEAEADASPTTPAFDPWAATDPKVFIRPACDTTDDEE